MNNQKTTDAVKKALTSHPLYNPETDKLHIEIEGLKHQKGGSVTIKYCKMPPSEYDITDSGQEFDMDEAHAFERETYPITGIDLSFYLHHSGTFARVDGYIHVHPNHRGKGTARQLDEMVIAVAKAIGLREYAIMEQGHVANFLVTLGYEIRDLDEDPHAFRVLE
jgi:GNAT superfamily N-acetyltransferase